MAMCNRKEEKLVSTNQLGDWGKEEEGKGTSKKLKKADGNGLQGRKSFPEQHAVSEDGCGHIKEKLLTAPCLPRAH